MPDKPHQSALRRNRFSDPGSVYAIVECVEGREALLVPYPIEPLRDPEPARLIVESLRWCHINEIWSCLAYTIMPDHLHVIFKLGEQKSLSDAMQSFGNFTALKINRHHGRSGKMWQKTFYDRMIRDEKELDHQVEYILQNPVRAGYVKNPTDWPYTEIYPDW